MKAPAVSLRTLIGSGDRIMLATLPVIVFGLILNTRYPEPFTVGGPPPVWRAVSAAVLAAGVVVWGWCVALLVAKVPHGELITTGPYALVKHPLYTAVALLVLPALGVLFDSWLGALAGAALYLASRRFAPAEEKELAATFGTEWERYRASVRIPWL